MFRLNTRLRLHLVAKPLPTCISPRTILLLALSMVLALGACSVQAKKQIEANEGYPSAPDFHIEFYETEGLNSLTKLNSHALLSQVVKLDDRPVLLNFWAGLCPPCKAEMPDFQSLWADHNENYLIIGIDIGPFVLLGTREEGMQLITDLRITYPVGTTYSPEIVQNYELTGMPTTFIIDNDGLIIKRYAGMLTKERALQLLNESVNKD